VGQVVAGLTGVVVPAGQTAHTETCQTRSFLIFPRVWSAQVVVSCWLVRLEAPVGECMPVGSMLTASSSSPSLRADRTLAGPTGVASPPASSSRATDAPPVPALVLSASPCRRDARGRELVTATVIEGRSDTAGPGAGSRGPVSAARAWHAVTAENTVGGRLQRLEAVTASTPGRGRRPHRESHRSTQTPLEVLWHQRSLVSKSSPSRSTGLQRTSRARGPRQGRAKRLRCTCCTPPPGSPTDGDIAGSTSRPPGLGPPARHRVRPGLALRAGTDLTTALPSHWRSARRRHHHPPGH
jgi:hypothetical protein